jgi:hypothetical protein
MEVKMPSSQESKPLRGPYFEPVLVILPRLGVGEQLGAKWSRSLLCRDGWPLETNLNHVTTQASNRRKEQETMRIQCILNRFVTICV